MIFANHFETAPFFFMTTKATEKYKKEIEWD